MKVRASPNIAFIKYWGKKDSRTDEDRNMALNPSISMTLSKANTTTEVICLPDLAFHKSQVWMGGFKANDKDRKKTLDHIKRVAHHFCVPIEGAFEVKSSNNFPTGTGMASSASAFAALTIAATGEFIGKNRLKTLRSSSPHILSQLARMGSGSASRSTQGGFMKWEGHFARHIPIEWRLLDTVVMFSSQHKKVSSTEGHESALLSPLLKNRLEKNLPLRLKGVEKALLEKNLSELGPLLEEEADELHALAATGRPPIIYAMPETKTFLSALREIKNRFFFYTLDAGPNVHIISEQPCRPEIEALLKHHKLRAEIWEDAFGDGPEILD